MSLAQILKTINAKTCLIRSRKIKEFVSYYPSKNSVINMPNQQSKWCQT